MRGGYILVYFKRHLPQAEQQLGGQSSRIVISSLTNEAPPPEKSILKKNKLQVCESVCVY